MTNWILLLGLFLASQQGVEVKYQRVSVGCFKASEAESQYIINNQHELDRALNKIRYYVNCNQEPTQIDFETKTLIGLKVHAGGCRRPDVNLEIIKANKMILISHNVTMDGACRKLWNYYFWVVIDKVDSEHIKFGRY